jgi:hypothetical protein
MKRNTVEQLIHTLNLSFELLPTDSSTIAYEIILICMQHHNEGKELPLKVIFLNKNFTEMGARSHLSRLEKSNWIEIVRSTQDLRVKVLKPTIRLINAFESFLRKIEN